MYHKNNEILERTNMAVFKFSILEPLKFNIFKKRVEPRQNYIL